jgi:hypothetical protein
LLSLRTLICLRLVHTREYNWEHGALFIFVAVYLAASTACFLVSGNSLASRKIMKSRAGRHFYMRLSDRPAGRTGLPSVGGPRINAEASPGDRGDP